MSVWKRPFQIKAIKKQQNWWFLLGMVIRDMPENHRILKLEVTSETLCLNPFYGNKRSWWRDLPESYSLLMKRLIIASASRPKVQNTFHLHHTTYLISSRKDRHDELVVAFEIICVHGLSIGQLCKLYLHTYPHSTHNLCSYNSKEKYESSVKEYSLEMESTQIVPSLHKHFPLWQW